MKDRRVPVPTPGYGEAVGMHQERSNEARRRDAATTAVEVVDDPDDWEPARNDLRGVDDAKRRRIESVRHPDYEGDDPEYAHAVKGASDAWEAAERMGTVAPVHGNPSMDPAGGDMVQVSYMAGYADDTRVGFDAMQGVGRMITGRADATGDLRVESGTPGAPLQMGATESLFSDDVGAGTHGLRMSAEEDPSNRDWCSAIRRAPDEVWL